jgi:metallopeptidase MepB
MLNYPPPTPSQPCLLKFLEVVSCFHELGHSIHWLVSRTACARFHGTKVARDFVEVPSRMLEHFFWDANVIRAVSSHYISGARLPDDAIASVLAGRFEHAASKALGDHTLATFDHTVHTTWEPARAADGSETDDSDFTDLSVWLNKFRHDISLLACVEDLGQGYDQVHGQSHFRAIGGSYGASYYSYLK